jgi:uncharacterized membrane protein YuzA (DUF378 family)
MRRGRIHRALRPVRNLLRAVIVGLLGVVLFDLGMGIVRHDTGPWEKAILVIVGVTLVFLALPLFRQEPADRH